MPLNRSALASVLLAILAVGIGVAYLQGSSGSSNGSPSPTARDQPAPVDQQPLARVAVAGDTGTGDAAEAATVEEMLDQSRGSAPYDAVVLLGDLVYDDGDAEEVDTAVTEPFAPLVDAGAELVPVLGNHDYMSGEQAEILAALGREGSWYVDQIGPLRIIVLDSERVDDPQQQLWLEGVLAETQPVGTWTIATMHHPAYSAGEHGSTPEVQESWVPLFTEHDVPLVLAGHDHDYQRSIPLDGVTYVVSGGGAKTRPTGEESFTATSSSTLHFLDLLVYDDRIVGRAIDQSGALVDNFTLTR